MELSKDDNKEDVKTTCPYCGVGCGVIARQDDENKWRTVGDPDHPANFGRLCSKGSALEETLDLDGRLLFPEIGGERASWGQAIDKISGKFREIMETDGPQAIGFYLSGQMLTEDYYVANKLAKGFIGSSHVDTNSRLCMASSVAGHKRAFGTDTVPNCYEDLDQADLIVLVGSNAAWCHPVLFQRMLKNKQERGAKIVSIDVRPTATSADADLSLIIKPGTDAYLFNGLLAYLSDSLTIDYVYVAEHCEGFENAVVTARETSPDAKTVARRCGLKEADVRAFWQLFRDTPKTLTCYSQGINQSSSGTNKVGAIVNCHLATGRIGKTGSGPLSLTGQPNAMGGREVGGLANQLAAHMDFDPSARDKVKRFWDAPSLVAREGLKAVDMFDAVYAGRIRAIWIMCTNPVVSLPRSSKIAEALSRAELVIVSDCMNNTDTIKHAHIKLPAATWGEKSGTVTNSERRISRQRSFLPLPGEAKPDWWAMCEVAKAMGFEQEFSFNGPGEIFDEHARLSAFENDGTRDFDLSGLTGMSAEDYDAMEPVQWPVTPEGAQSRLFEKGGFFRPNKKAVLQPVVPELPKERATTEYPIILNTGRVRDHWHTMTRTSKSPRLSSHRNEPFVELSPVDAEKRSLAEGDLARVSSAHGEALLRVRIDPSQPVGMAFSPIHWSGQNSACGRVGDLITGHCDPFSGQPESKTMPIDVKRVALSSSALLLSRDPLDVKEMPYWAEWTTSNCKAYALGATSTPEQGWSQWFKQKLGGASHDLLEYWDAVRGDYRAALFAGDTLISMLTVRQNMELVSTSTLDAFFAKESFEPSKRRAVLSLRSLDGLADKGPTVCACFSVGLNEISAIIASGKAVSAEDVGKLLKAGTNCGSCVPEIRGLFEKTAAFEAAE